MFKKTQTLSARVEDTSRLSARHSLSEYVEGPPPPSGQLTVLLLETDAQVLLKKWGKISGPPKNFDTGLRLGIHYNC